MRKEHQKAFQEKQKLNPDKRKDGFDLTTLLEDSKDEKRLLNRSNESDYPVIIKTSNKDSEKSSLPPQTSQSRPLVPPGFASTISERNSGPKPAIHPHTTEVTIFYFHQICMHGKVGYLKKEIREMQRSWLVMHFLFVTSILFFNCLVLDKVGQISSLLCCFDSEE